MRCTDPYDPKRCQAVHETMQCPYMAVEGRKFCPRHVGQAGLPDNARSSRYEYRLGKFHSRVKDFAENPMIKNLRDEIGVLRVILEELMTQCNDSQELLFASGKITMIIDKIRDLVRTAHDLDTKLGNQLSKVQVVETAETILSIVCQHVKDPSALAKIADALAAKIFTRAADAFPSSDVIIESTGRLFEEGGNAPEPLLEALPEDGKPLWSVEFEPLPVVEAATG